METLETKTPDIADFAIVVKDKKIPFSKATLCEQSDYFKGMLSHTMQEHITSEVNWDETFEDVADLLAIINPKTPAEITEDNVQVVFKLAYKYDFQKVVEKCMIILNKSSSDSIKRILFIRSCQEEYSEDKDICAKLDNTMTIAINALLTHCHFHHVHVDDLPKDILVRVFDGLWEKNQNKRKTISKQEYTITSYQGIVKRYNEFAERIIDLKERYMPKHSEDKYDYYLETTDGQSSALEAFANMKDELRIICKSFRKKLKLFKLEE
jgi:hypothetical protein